MTDAPLRVLIVDDEAPARRRLRELLDDCTSAVPLRVIGEAGSGREALALLGTTPADLVLTDIHMPDMDGIELARHLLKLPVPPVLIFTTAYHEHAIAAFEVHAIDYLVKPVRVQRLLSALDKVPRLRPLSDTKLDRLPSAARRFLSVTERSRVVLVPLEEIVYLKAELKYITIRTADREYPARGIADAARRGVRPALRARASQLPRRARRHPRLRAPCLRRRRRALGSAAARRDRSAARIAAAAIHRARDRARCRCVSGVPEPETRRSPPLLHAVTFTPHIHSYSSRPYTLPLHSFTVSWHHARSSAVRSRSIRSWSFRTGSRVTSCPNRRTCCRCRFWSAKCAASGADAPATSPTT